MSRESDIIDYVNSKAKPVSLSELTKNVPGDYLEAQIYASANQACTKQKIARGPEKNTYCRIDYAEARISKSNNNIVHEETFASLEPKRKNWTEALNTPKEMEVKPKKQRKAQETNRYGLAEVIEDLNSAGLELVPRSKTENSAAFPVMGDYGADYIVERAKQILKVNKVTKYAQWNVGMSVVIGVYP